MPIPCRLMEISRASQPLGEMDIFATFASRSFLPATDKIGNRRVVRPKTCEAGRRQHLAETSFLALTNLRPSGGARQRHRCFFHWITFITRVKEPCSVFFHRGGQKYTTCLAKTGCKDFSDSCNRPFRNTSRQFMFRIPITY